MKDRRKKQTKKLWMVFCSAMFLMFSGISAAFVYDRLAVPMTVICSTVQDCNPLNPARGPYIQNPSDYPQSLERHAGKVSLILLTYDLYDYRDRSISEEKLKELETFLQAARELELQCIFRPAYGFDPKECNDADSMDRIREHIRQFAPILNRYKSQIYCVQAGLLGPWGEWHASCWMDGEDGRDNRCAVLQALLEHLDGEICVGVRRPRFIREALEAGLDGARLGFYNDGLLGSDTDLGTYDDRAYTREEELAWVQQSLSSPMGGELPYVNPYSALKNAVKEFDRLNTCYLNLECSREVYDSWKQEELGDVDGEVYVMTHLGYRFRVKSISYPDCVRDRFLWRAPYLEVELENVGFGTIDRRYRAEWVLVTAEGETIAVPIEAKLWEVQTQQSILLRIPAKIIGDLGIRRVGIRIRRAEEETITDRTCVRLVNGLLPYENGVNFLARIDLMGSVTPEESGSAEDNR